MFAAKRPGVAVTVARGLLGVALALLPLSCAQTAREAARHATPAAVEGAVEEAEDPNTRANVSKILADSRIRNASAQLAESVTAGAVEGLTQDKQTARLEELGSRLVREFTATMTQTALSEMGNAEFEQRLESAVRSATAGAMRGVGEAARDHGPEFLSFAGVVAREAGRNAALGMDEAVRQRQLDAEAGRTNDEGVLVGMGKPPRPPCTAYHCCLAPFLASPSWR